MMRRCVAIRLSVYLPIHESTYLPVSVNRLTAAQCLYKSHHSIQFHQFALSHSLTRPEIQVKMPWAPRSEFLDLGPSEICPAVR